MADWILSHLAHLVRQIDQQHVPLDEQRLGDLFQRRLLSRALFQPCIIDVLWDPSAFIIVGKGLDERGERGKVEVSGIALEERCVAEVNIRAGFDTDVDPNGAIMRNAVDSGVLRRRTYILILILNAENVECQRRHHWKQQMR